MIWLLVFNKILAVEWNLCLQKKLSLAVLVSQTVVSWIPDSVTLRTQSSVTLRTEPCGEDHSLRGCRGWGGGQEGPQGSVSCPSHAPIPICTG